MFFLRQIPSRPLLGCRAAPLVGLPAEEQWRLGKPEDLKARQPNDAAGAYKGANPEKQAFSVH
jgi:hypothetical protein